MFGTINHDKNNLWAFCVDIDKCMCVAVTQYIVSRLWYTNYESFLSPLTSIFAVVGGREFSVIKLLMFTYALFYE